MATSCEPGMVLLMPGEQLENNSTNCFTGLSHHLPMTHHPSTNPYPLWCPSFLPRLDSENWVVWVAVQKGSTPAETDVLVKRMCWAQSNKKIPTVKQLPDRTLSLESLFFALHRKNQRLISDLATRSSTVDCFVPVDKLAAVVESEQQDISLEAINRFIHRAPGAYFPSQLLRSDEPINILVDMGEELGLWPMKRDYRAYMGHLVMNIRKGYLASLAVSQLCFFNVDYEEMREDLSYHFSGLHLAAMIVLLTDLENCLQMGKTSCFFQILEKESSEENQAKRRIVYKDLQMSEGFRPRFVVVNQNKEYLYLQALVRCLPQPKNSQANALKPMDAALKKMMQAELSSSPKEEEPCLPASSPAIEPEEVSQRGSQSPLACLDEELETEEESPDSSPPPHPPAQEIPIDLGEALLYEHDHLYLRPSSSSLGPILHPLSELWGVDLDEPTLRWSSPPLEQ